MSLTLTAPPAGEPLTLAEAKAFLRIEETAEDTYVTSLIATSRQQVEAALGLALMDQSWRLVGDPDAAGCIGLPRHPVKVVSAVSDVAEDGSLAVLDPEDYQADLTGRPATLSVLAPRSNVHRVAIDFDAGFGPLPDNVPGPIRQALLMLVAHWFENREPVLAGSSAATIPVGISDLLAPYRQVRI